MSLMTSSFTNQCYSFHIKDQAGIVPMKLTQLLQHRSKSPEVDKANESNHDKDETKYIEGTWKWRHLDVVLFNSSFLAHILHLHRYSAAKILRAIICQLVITFIKWTHFVRKQTHWWQQLFSISKFAVKGTEINQEGTLSHHGYLWNYKKEDPLFC